MIGECRVQQPRRAIDHALDRERPHRHLAQFVFDGAEARDGAAELMSVGRIPRGLTDGDPGTAVRRNRQLEPTVVEGVESDLVSSPNLSQDIVRWYPNVLEDDRRRR